MLVAVVVDDASVRVVGSSDGLDEFVEGDVNERMGSEEHAVIDATAVGDAAASP